MAQVIIGIQARSTSKRLPGKCLEQIEQLSMCDHVLRACESAADHMNRQSHKFRTRVDVALLVPYGDKLINNFKHANIIEGDEDDVLSRYVRAMQLYDADYICRITSDCPLISPPLISKHVVSAVQDGLDFCSNVLDGCRTYINGYDVEVMSREALDWIDNEAKEAFDREHVTTLFKRHTPNWAKIGTVIGHIDFSDIKLSVDTHDELEEVRSNKRSVIDKLNKAKHIGRVYRF